MSKPFSHCNVCGVRLSDDDALLAMGMCRPCADNDDPYQPDDPDYELDTCDDCGGTGYDKSAPDDGTEDFDVCKTCGGHG